MRYIICFIIISICTSSTFAQQTKTQSLNIEGLDLSYLWLTEHPRFYEGEEIDRTEPVGYYGDNYWRFYIHFISVIQNPENPKEYLIYGKDKLKDNIREIQGTLKIESSEVYEEDLKEGIQEGIIKGSYQLYEDRKKPETGKLSGKFETYVMMSNNKIEYSTLYWFADGYKNNQFEGIWTSYSSGKTYICNWGDYRVPNRQGFDIGAGQMGVHPDYEKNGWENFELATFPIANSEEHRKKIQEAKIKEAEKWWK